MEERHCGLLRAFCSQESKLIWNALNEALSECLNHFFWNKDAINVLLDALADPNTAAIDGYTCVHEAIHQECSKVVLRAIISHGANMNAADNISQTALMLACAEGNIDAINVF